MTWRYTDETRTMAVRDRPDGGSECCLASTLAGIEIADCQPPPLTATHVRLEAQRRILARYSMTAQLNMQARATELVLARIGRDWSADEASEAVALQSSRDWIKSVRDASNAMEANPPVDYTADARWPA